MKKIGLTIVLLCIVFGIKAQFNLNAEFRPRTEVSHGYKALPAANQDASLFTTQRTRLNFAYKNDKIKTKLSLQDVRLWGNQPQLVGNEDFATSIHEAWAEAFFNDNFSLKLGRQELVYDNSRIFGNVGWAQQARSHDLFLFKYKKDFELHLGAAFNQDANRTTNFYFGPDAYKMMQFIWFNKSWDNFKLSFLFLNNGKTFNTFDTLGNITDQQVKYSQTFGPYFSYKTGDLKFEGNFYYQMGKTASDMDISAYDLLFNAFYKMDKFTLGLGYELLSGNSYKDTLNETFAFTPFYGTNHKFNGHMDYFYVGNHMNSVGLSDINMTAKYKFDKSILALQMHYFSAAADISANTDKYLGTEFDFSYGYKLSEQSSIKAGISYLLASKSMEVIRSGNKDENPYWGYLMFSFTPKFL